MPKIGSEEKAGDWLSPVCPVSAAIKSAAGPAGTFRHRTELTRPARDLLAKPGIDPPGQIHQLTPGT